jgi:Universal stress protein family
MDEIKRILAPTDLSAFSAKGLVYAAQFSTHGRSGLSRMLLGSVTEKVLRKARLPVLAIPCHEQ